MGRASGGRFVLTPRFSAKSISTGSSRSVSVHASSLSILSEDEGGTRILCWWQFLRFCLRVWQDYFLRHYWNRDSKYLMDSNFCPLCRHPLKSHKYSNISVKGQHSVHPCAYPIIACVHEKRKDVLIQLTLIKTNHICHHIFYEKTINTINVNVIIIPKKYPDQTNNTSVV